MLALTKPADTVMRFGVADGGHFATENIIKLFGRKSCTYGFDRERLTIDLAATEQVFQREKPKLLYLDAMNYLFPFPIRQLREIVGDTPIIYDASHTLGLIAGGRFQDPLREGADILQANTHKTLFGPQKGIILSNNRELMERVTYALSQGLVYSQHTAPLLSLLIALHEARQFGREYSGQIIENAQFLASRLAQLGVPVLARGDGQHTQNHHFFVNLTGVASAPHEMERLLQARLVVQRGVPFRNVDALRIGVQEITRLGYSHAELSQIAGWIADLLKGRVTPGEVAPLVVAMARAHTRVLYTGEVAPLPATLSPERPVDVTTPSPVGRWLDYRHLGVEFDLPTKQMDDLHGLGLLASNFPNQTDTSGNISVRQDEEVYVTTSGCYIKHLQPEHVAKIGAVSGEIMDYWGQGMPSSESLMHWLIYKNTDAGAIVHTHYILSNQEAKDLDVAIVTPQEYASVELARQVAAACRHRDIVYVQRHGLIFYGADAAGCRHRIEDFVRYHHRANHV
jgi:fluorothreonine transaldolase